MDGLEICKEVAGLHGSILNAGIVERGVPIAMHSKPDAPLPRQDRLERTFAQAEIAIRVFQTNQDNFGKTHYIMAHNDSSDLFFFPIVINGRDMILLVRAATPYFHEELVGKVRDYIGNMRMAGK
jgi:DNA-binding LytR/AlgR family response regulator